MKKAFAMVLIVQLISLLPVIAFASEELQPVRPVESNEAIQEGERPVIAVVKTPAMLEIDALLEVERVQLAELKARLQAAPDEETALAIQREVRQLKMETELEILRVQIRSAREMGRLDTVERLEQTIEYLTNPRPVNPPVERVRPSAQQR